MNVLILLLMLNSSIPASHLDADSGLSQSTIWQVMQDRTGFLWFATGSGLNRWDGYRFTIYLKDEDDPNSLPQNYVRCIAEDSRGMIWAGTSSGLCYFDPSENAFFVPDLFREVGLDKASIRSLTVDQNVMWIGTRRNLWRYQQDSDKLEQIPLEGPPGSPHPWGWQSIRRTLSMRDHLWVGTEAGLIRYHRETGTVSYLLPEDPTAAPLAIRDLAKTPDGTIWVATASGLYRWQDNNQTWQQFGQDPMVLEDPWINVLLAMPDGTLFVGTQSAGLFRFDPRTNQFKSTSITSDHPWDQNILCLLRDHNDLIWAGTFRTGVYYFDSKPPPFSEFGSELGLPEGSAIHALHSETNGNVWIGSDTQLYLYNGQVQKLTRIPWQPGPQARIKKIARGQRDQYWIATQRQLYRFEQDAQTFEQQQLDIPASARIYDVAVSGSRVWVGTSQGLFYREAEQDWQRFSDQNSGINWERSHFTRLIGEFNGGIWLATTTQGLIYISGRSQQVQRWAPLEELPDMAINDIDRDLTGVIWMGTPYGLFALETDRKTITNHSAHHVSLGTQITSVNQAPNQRLWLGTPSNLLNYNPANGTLKRFDSQQGLQLTHYYPDAMSYLPDGRLLIGGEAGLYTYDPSRAQEKTTIPRLVFTEVRIFDKVYRSGTQMQRTDRLKLKPNQNHLTVSFAALDYRAPHENRFSYKLEGLDEQWIDAENRHNARYNDLEGGNYRFRVRALKNGQPIPRSEISLTISIRPHFWQQMWFWVIFVLVCLLVIILTDRWRERAIQNRNQQLEKLVEERKRELETTKMQLLETAHFAGIHDIANTVLNQMKQELDLIRTSIRQIQKAEKDNGMPALAQATTSFRQAMETSDPDTADRLFATAQSGFQVFLQQAGLARDQIETHTAKLEKHVSTMRETIQLQHSLAKNPLFASEVNLRDLLEDTLKLERGDIQRIKVRIKRDYRTEGLLVLPKVKMMKVMTQLVRNSLEAMARANTVNPTLTLRLDGEEGEAWRIEVEDNGPGIDPKNLEKVTKQGWSSVGQAGLGLHETVRALKELKGHLSLEPGEHGEGTKAIITLPKN